MVLWSLYLCFSVGEKCIMVILLLKVLTFCFVLKQLNILGIIWQNKSDVVLTIYQIFGFLIWFVLLM